MITVRHAQDRGHFDFGWLDTQHSFSFGHYYDGTHMGFGDLRVINEDRVMPGKGFDTHGHRNMEIVTVIIDGELEHKDSLGNGSVIRPGEVQRMTAGTGIRHSEYNGSHERPVHLLQIWIEPERSGLEPGYEQSAFPKAQNGLHLVGSRDGRDGSVTIHQDVSLYTGDLNAGASVSHLLRPGRRAWVQIIGGRVDIDGTEAAAGDGVAVEGQDRLTILAEEDAAFLLFDLR